MLWEALTFLLHRATTCWISYRSGLHRRIQEWNLLPLRSMCWLRRDWPSWCLPNPLQSHSFFPPFRWSLRERRSTLSLSFHCPWIGSLNPQMFPTSDFSNGDHYSEKASNTRHSYVQKTRHEGMGRFLHYSPLFTSSVHTLFGHERLELENGIHLISYAGKWITSFPATLWHTFK